MKTIHLRISNRNKEELYTMFWNGKEKYIVIVLYTRIHNNTVQYKIKYFPPLLSLVYKLLSILGEYCVLLPLSSAIPSSFTPSTLTANCTHTKSCNIMASVHTALTCRLTDHLLRNFECISNCLTTQSNVPTKQCIVHN